MITEKEIQSPLSTQNLFPKKEDLLGTLNFQPIKILSNHFPIKFDQNIQFNEWFIRFLPKEKEEEFLKDPRSVEDPVPKDSRLLYREILRSNRAEMQRELGNHFDSGSTLFSFGKIENLKDSYLFSNHVKFSLSVELKNKKCDLNSIIPNENQRKQLLRFLNSKLKHILKQLNFYEFGRNKKYYNFDQKVDVPQHKVEIYKGFKTAFDCYEGGVRLLIDNSCRILRTRNLWQEFLEENIHQDDMNAVRRFFQGVNCVASYGNNRRYRIEDVEFSLKADSPFPDPNFTSYADYFKQRYKKNVNYKNQFMLISKTKFLKKVGDHQFEEIENIVHLIPELLQGTGLTDRQKRNFGVMKDIGRTTIQFPAQRFSEIEGLAHELSHSPQDSFNFKVDTKNNQITAYKMSKPRLKCESNFQPQGDRIHLQNLYKNKPIKKWVFLYDFKNKRDVDSVIGKLQQASKKFKIDFRNPVIVRELPNRIKARQLPELYEDKVRDPEIVFFFVSQRTADFLYSDAKSFYQKIGIPVQFYTSFNFRKDMLSKYSNIALQMVNKIGGALWVYETAPKDTLAIGIDKIRLKDGTFLAAGVSQMGKYFRRPHAALEKVQSEGDSLHKAVSRLVVESCQYYKSKYDIPPKNLIVYRQCESARDLQKLVQEEIYQTKSDLESVFEKDKIVPKLTMILVTKKINDRFVEQTPRGLGNPEGIAVLDDVVMKNRANFFLVAQKVNQGTATPTHYQVVFSETEFKLEELVKISYDLTYLYLNWMGPVRIPSALQYVEKLCSLVAISQQAKISKNIRSLLFFL